MEWLSIGMEMEGMAMTVIGMALWNSLSCGSLSYWSETALLERSGMVIRWNDSGATTLADNGMTFREWLLWNAMEW